MLACSGKPDANKSAGKGAPPAPVTVGRVERRTVPITLSNIGTIEAPATVSIKSKIGGELTKVYISEGQKVKAGDPLFEIDRRPYEIALQQAQAELGRQDALLKQAQAERERDLAQMNNAESQLERNRKLAKTGVISRDDFDKLDATAKSLRASVAADEAAIASAGQAGHAARISIDNARLQLSYCTLRAPLTGRLGDLHVDQGNLVKADADTGLVTINQIQPINVAFTLPEAEFGRVTEAKRKGPLTVMVTLPDENNEAEDAGKDTDESDGAAAAGNGASTGTLTFIDNQVDRQTGTIRLKGEFANADERLWPGQFVNVDLVIGQLHDATLAPRRAILTGQSGQYCYVVAPGKTVKSRTVTTGAQIGDALVIKSGLAPGERIVLDGQLRLVDGAKIIEKRSGSAADADDAVAEDSDPASAASTPNANGASGAKN